MMEIHRLGELKTALGECPQWHAQQLWLMDCRAGFILALDPDTGEVRSRHAAPPPLGSFAFNGDGADAIVLALKEEIASLDLRSGELRTLARIEVSAPHLRLNDGAMLLELSRVRNCGRLLQLNRYGADSSIAGEGQFRQGPASLLAVLGNWR